MTGAKGDRNTKFSEIQNAARLSVAPMMDGME